jgi:hypothetical protein
VSVLNTCVTKQTKDKTHAKPQLNPIILKAIVLAGLQNHRVISMSTLKVPR